MITAFPTSQELIVSIPKFVINLKTSNKCACGTSTATRHSANAAKELMCNAKSGNFECQANSETLGSDVNAKRILQTTHPQCVRTLTKVVARPLLRAPKTTAAVVARQRVSGR